MLSEERDYLLVEFSESFQHMGKLDDRRFEILQFYSAFIAAVIAASITILSVDALASRYRAAGVVALLVVSALVSWASARVLVSERRATERYRNKLNAIRDVILAPDSSPELKAFFELGPSISVDTKRHESKELLFFDLLRPGRRCTALYIKVLIDVGGLMSLVLAVLVAWAGLNR